MATRAKAGLSGGSKPPDRPAPPAVSRAREALRIMERGEWVSDGVAYATRYAAAGTAARLKRAVNAHLGVERECMTQRVRVTRDGWRWWLALSDRVGDKS